VVSQQSPPRHLVLLGEQPGVARSPATRGGRGARLFRPHLGLGPGNFPEPAAKKSQHSQPAPHASAMLRSTVCPFCDVKSLLRPAWQQSRSYAQTQRPRPGRMVLSSRVRQGPAKPSPSGKPSKRRIDGPFAAMNQTEARIRNSPGLRPSQAQIKRSSGGKDRTQKDESDFKALKMQRALATVGYGRRSSIKEKISNVTSFDAFKLLPVVLDSISTQGLAGLVDVAPTPIQRVAIPALTGSFTKRRRSSMAEKDKMDQFLLAAETGSGKTLAYLVPVLDAMKRQEALDLVQEKKRLAEEDVENSKQLFEIEPPPLSNQPDPRTGRPRVIVLVPSGELVAQVGAVAKSFSHTVSTVRPLSLLNILP